MSLCQCSLSRVGTQARPSTSIQTSTSSPRPVVKGSRSGTRSKIGTRSTTGHSKAHIKTTASNTKDS